MSIIFSPRSGKDGYDEKEEFKDVGVENNFIKEEYIEIEKIQ